MIDQVGKSEEAIKLEGVNIATSYEYDIPNHPFVYLLISHHRRSAGEEFAVVHKRAKYDGWKKDAKFWGDERRVVMWSDAFGEPGWVTHCPRDRWIQFEDTGKARTFIRGQVMMHAQRQEMANKNLRQTS